MSSKAQGNPFFTPTQISGCTLWLDPSDLTTFTFNGTGLTQWRDKSTTAAIFTGSATPPTLSATTYNRNKPVSFGGSSYFQSTTFPFTTSSRTTFFVYDETTEQNNVGVLSFASSGTDYNQLNTMVYETGFKSLSQYLQLVQIYALQFQTSSIGFALYSDTFGSTVETAYVNGSQTATTTSGAAFTNSTGLVIGARMLSGSISNYLIGVIGEIILYNRPLTTAERQQVEGYLAWKWGLQSSLPANHPYKNSPIPPLLNPPTTLPVALAGAFQPTQIPGLALWLDASDTTTITGSLPITRWADKSGTGKTVTFAGTSNTYNSLTQSVTTDNSTNSYFYANVNLKRSVVTYASVFIVYTWIGTAINVDQALWGQDIGGGWNRFQLLSFPSSAALAYGLSYRGTATPNVTVVSSLNTPNRLVYTATYAYNITNGTFVNINGSLASSVVTELAASPSETSTTNTYFGTINTDFSGRVAFHEILIYTTNLSVAERQQVEGYLAWKWNLSSSLPSDFPYKTIPPSLTSLPIYPRSVITYGIWNPIQISGCGLWLDGADKTTLTYQSGNNVSIWTDKSAGIQAQFLTNAMASARWTAGSNSTGSTGATNYPVSGSNINGVNALYFNQAVLQAITTQNVNTRSYFLVLQLPSNSTGPGDNILWPATWVSGYARGASLTVDSSTFTLASQNVANLLVLNVTPKNPTLVSVTFNNGTPGMWNAGGGTTTATGQSSSSLNFSGSTDNYLWIGGASGIFTSTGFILGEFLEYNSALTTSQRQQVEGYLAWKWGLQKSLPANHPWVNWPPPPS